MDLQNLITTIAAKSEVLKNKIIGSHKTKLSYTCIFAQNAQQHEQIEAQLEKIGRIVDATTTGNVYMIQPIETAAGPARIVKNRRPDPTRTELGDCDFELDDYAKFKGANIGNPGFSLINRPAAEMIEYMERGGEVRLYFSNPPVSFE